MKAEIFIDSSGFYALLAKRDSMHQKAIDILQQAAQEKISFITTDYIIDETATLLQARKLSHILSAFFDTVFESSACTIAWMDQDRFLQTKSFFLKHKDQSWSFTDCFSFILMKELNLKQALTKDNHFTEAGFAPLLV
jgi:predicted nucleic acid-binding protein